MTAGVIGQWWWDSYCAIEGAISERTSLALFGKNSFPLLSGVSLTPRLAQMAGVANLLCVSLTKPSPNPKANQNKHK